MAIGASHVSSEWRSKEKVQMAKVILAPMKASPLGMERGRSVEDIVAVVRR